jgi:hypothetical protein
MTDEQRGASAINAIRAPFRLLDFVFTIVFLFAVAHVCWNARRLDWLYLFLGPPLFALIAYRSPKSRWSTRLIAAIFLALISVGDIVAFFSDLHTAKNFPGLSRHENFVLMWYVLIYMLYLFVIFPPVLFLRPLIDRWKGRPTYFHAFTCYLGLLTWLIMGPAVIYLLISALIYKHPV